MPLEILTAWMLFYHTLVVTNYQDWCGRSATGPAYAECMSDTPTLRTGTEGDWLIDLSEFAGFPKLKMIYHYDHVPYLIRSSDDSSH